MNKLFLSLMLWMSVLMVQPLSAAAIESAPMKQCCDDQDKNKPNGFE